MNKNLTIIKFDDTTKNDYSKALLEQFAPKLTEI